MKYLVYFLIVLLMKSSAVNAQVGNGGAIPFAFLLSDTHLGKSNERNQLFLKFIDNFIRQTGAIPNSRVIILGDLVDDPRDDDAWRVAKTGISRLRSAGIVVDGVIGNHDQRSDGFGVYHPGALDIWWPFAGLNPNYPRTMNIPGIGAASLINSGQNDGADRAQGHVGSGVLSYIPRWAQTVNGLRIVCLHHDPYNRNTGWNLSARLRDSGDLKDAAAQGNIDLVLSGHTNSGIADMRGRTIFYNADAWPDVAMRNEQGKVVKIYVPLVYSDKNIWKVLITIM